MRLFNYIIDISIHRRSEYNHDYIRHLPLLKRLKYRHRLTNTLPRNGRNKIQAVKHLREYTKKDYNHQLSIAYAKHLVESWGYHWTDSSK